MCFSLEPFELFPVFRTRVATFVQHTAQRLRLTGFPLRLGDEWIHVPVGGGYRITDRCRSSLSCFGFECAIHLRYISLDGGKESGEDAHLR